MYREREDTESNQHHQHRHQHWNARKQLHGNKVTIVSYQLGTNLSSISFIDPSLNTRRRSNNPNLHDEAGMYVSQSADI